MSLPRRFQVVDASSAVSSPLEPSTVEVWDGASPRWLWPAEYY